MGVSNYVLSHLKPDPIELAAAKEEVADDISMIIFYSFERECRKRKTLGKKSYKCRMKYCDCMNYLHYLPRKYRDRLEDNLFYIYPEDFDIAFIKFCQEPELLTHLEQYFKDSFFQSYLIKQKRKLFLSAKW